MDLANVYSLYDGIHLYVLFIHFFISWMHDVLLKKSVTYAG